MKPPRILVGTRKGLFELRRDSSNGEWSPNGKWKVAKTAFLGVPVSAVLGEPGGERIHVALDHGHFGTKMHRSIDGGSSWDEVAVPTYPEKPAGVVDKDPMRQVDIEWKLQLLWCLEYGGVPGRLWAGTIPGGLFRSDDGGDSWQINEPLWDPELRKKWVGGGADRAGLHSVVVDPRDPNHVVCGVSCGGVWRTRDGGASWEQTAHGMRYTFGPPEHQTDPDGQDPHCIVACKADPDVYWCQHHCGIFRSTDGAKSWQEIERNGPSTFGFPVAVHPADPDTAWFLPAVKDEERIPEGGRVVMSRTRDGGKTFEVLTNGLPQTHAYDLCFRHALDIDSSGNCLAFGSTTGSVWVTEDQGDSFQHVSAHLPPVYCVRIVE